LHNRWFALAVLFVIRLTMAFQFQSVAAVAPLLGDTFGVSLADIGWLIGLYFAPGLVLALPGGAIGRRFGDRPTVVASLLLMLVGELAMALSPSWVVQIAGRLVSGAGGVMFNVQMTKMVADWFAGQEIATAMAIFVNSWPAGIALSLVCLPLVATAFGVEAVYLTVAASIALGLVFFAAAYPSPPKTTTTAKAGSSSWPDHTTFIALTAAGLIWGLFHVGFAMIFSFGPTMLVDIGGRLHHQHRAVACGDIRSARRLFCRSHPTAEFGSGRGLHHLRRADEHPATQRRGDLDRHGDRIAQWPAGRTDHEFASAGLEAGDARDRHGHFLHPLLRHDDAGPGCRRRLGQIDRPGGHGARFRSSGHPGVSAFVVGLQPSATKSGVSRFPPSR
jgi:hypothetical protein